MSTPASKKSRTAVLRHRVLCPEDIPQADSPALYRQSRYRSHLPLCGQNLPRPLLLSRSKNAGSNGLSVGITFFPFPCSGKLPGCKRGRQGHRHGWVLLYNMRYAGLQKQLRKLPAILPQPPNLFYDASWIFTRSPACTARVLLTMTCVSASSAPLTAAVVSPVSTTVTGSDTTIFC